MNTYEIKLIIDARDMTEEWIDKIKALGCFEIDSEKDGIHAYCAFQETVASPVVAIAGIVGKVGMAGFKVRGIIWHAEELHA